MSVASLELCKELYELSGWEDTSLSHYQLQSDYGVAMHEYGWDILPSDTPMLKQEHQRHIKKIPAYDAGYLLEKLANWNGALRISLDRAGGKKWHVDLNNIENLPYASGGTPADALCKLAIELFKQGVLENVKGGNDGKTINATRR